MIKLLILSILVCNSYSIQSYINITNDAEYLAAINNPKYTATIVDLMSATCGWSIYMRSIFENFSTLYKNILFAEVFFNNYTPKKELVPGLFNGSWIRYPIMMVYKNGVKVEGSPGVRSKEALEKMIIRNGG